MPPRTRRRVRQAKSRPTRKTSKRGSVLNVLSPAAVKSFEKILSRGPLTLVYVNAKWCGACHKFTDEVWSPLTQMKNKTMNMAAVDSEMIGKTSLANVPRKFFPTLLLVGKDKKPAVFKDEEGLPTNAMPRKNTLSEDKNSLSTLLQSINKSKTSNNQTTKNKTLKFKMNSRNSPPRAVITPSAALQDLDKTPFGNANAEPSIVNESLNPEVSRTIKIETVKGMPPDVGSDLVASQRPGTPYPRGGARVGRMLNAIREKAASFGSILSLRNHSTRKSRQ
jgi:thiol-disulfide isomerase/thioredoxin